MESLTLANVLSIGADVAIVAGLLMFPLGRKFLWMLFVMLPLAIVALLAFSEPDLRD